MATATFDDALQQAAHLAHKARVLKTIAADAVEAHIAETAHRIRKDPFTFVGLAFAIGVPVGALLGWMFSRRRSPVPVSEGTRARAPFA